MAKKRIVMAIGHKDMGTNLPEQKEAVKRTAKVIADFIQDGWQVAIVHSNAPQVGMNSVNSTTDTAPLLCLYAPL